MIDNMKIEKNIKDYPKLESPFVRKEINDEYVVVDEVNEGYEWVFEDENVKAVEKLHGTNVSVLIEDGHIIGSWNRKNRVPYYSDDGGDQYIIEGIHEALKRGYIDELPDGQHFGELIGEKFHNNPYDIDGHIWIPFKRLKRTCAYKSWGDYPKTFESISEWFKNNLIPLWYVKFHGMSFDEAMNEGFVEGIVFHHPDGRKAKLRKDMFGWYEGERH